MSSSKGSGSSGLLPPTTKYIIHALVYKHKLKTHEVTAFIDKHLEEFLGPGVTMTYWKAKHAQRTTSKKMKDIKKDYEAALPKAQSVYDRFLEWKKTTDGMLSIFKRTEEVKKIVQNDKKTNKLMHERRAGEAAEEDEGGDEGEEHEAASPSAATGAAAASTSASKAPKTHKAPKAPSKSNRKSSEPRPVKSPKKSDVPSPRLDKKVLEAQHRKGGSARAVPETPANLASLTAAGSSSRQGDDSDGGREEKSKRKLKRRATTTSFASDTGGGSSAPSSPVVSSEKKKKKKKSKRGEKHRRIVESSSSEAE